MIPFVAIAFAVATFPYGDIPPAAQHPSPATILTLAADVAVQIVPFHSQARIAVLGLAVAKIMISHPSRNPIAEGQLSLKRGGRRR